MGGNRSRPARQRRSGQPDGQERQFECKQNREQRPDVPASERVMESSAPASGEDPDADSARQHPSRITHGFWLKQYSGLHEHQPAPPSRPNTFGGSRASSSGRNHGASAATSHITRRCWLLTRWTQLMMGRPGGSSPGNLSAGARLTREPLSRSTGARSAPPPATASEAGDGPQIGRARKHQRRPRTANGKHSQPGAGHHGFRCPMCLARTISSSTPSSASPSPTSSFKGKHIRSASTTRDRESQQQTARGEQQQPRRLLPDWLLLRPSSPAAGGGSPQVSPCRLSPYKQITRFLAGRQGPPPRLSAEQQVGPIERAARRSTSELTGAPRDQPAPAPGSRSKAVKSGTTNASSSSSGSNLLASLFTSPTKRLNRLKGSRGGGAVDEKQPPLGSLGDGMQATDEPAQQQHHQQQQRRKRKVSGASVSKLSDKLVIGGGGGKGGERRSSGSEFVQAGQQLDKSQARETCAIRASPSAEPASDRAAPSLSRSSSLSSGSSCRQPAAKRHHDEPHLAERAAPRREPNVAHEHFTVANEITTNGDIGAAAAASSSSFLRLSSKGSSFKHKASERTSARGESDESSPAMTDNRKSLEGSKQDPHRASSRSIKFEEDPQQRATIEECDQQQQQQQQQQRASDSPDELESEQLSTMGPRRPLVAASSSSASFLPLTRPLASSSSSFNSSIGCLGGASSPNELCSQQATSQLDFTRPTSDFHAPHISLRLAGERSPNEPIERPVSQPVGPLGNNNGGEQMPPTTPTATMPSSKQQQPKQATGFKSNFKKFVKRQQSVDSYRMARDLKQKLKRQQEGERKKHQSNEAIKATRSVGDEPGGRKFSMRNLIGSDSAADYSSGSTRPNAKGFARQVKMATGSEAASGAKELGASQTPVEICVDPYARPGSFMLPGEEGALSTQPEEPAPDSRAKPKVSPTPPNTLSLAPSNLAGSSNSLLMGSGFSGCITPTYPTHHLPSPKYVSPATLLAMQKKYSNASTISSSFGGELAGNSSSNYQTLANEPLHSNGTAGANLSSGNISVAAGTGQPAIGVGGAAPTGQQSDTESSFSITPSGRASRSEEAGGGGASRQLNSATSPSGQLNGGLSSAALRSNAAAAAEALAREEAAAALRRAQLAEHIYDNKCGLGEDMKFLASLPELCDITFLVGETREPVCAVKSVLAARSRVFHKILFGNRVRAINHSNQLRSMIEPPAAPTQTLGEPSDADQTDRRGSSPRSAHISPSAAGRTLVSLAKSSLPSSRSNSPNQLQQQQQQQWSVTSDASGYNASRPAAPMRADSLAAGSRSGRTSVASNHRESISQASLSSQQPLIIGPGQTATPAPKQRHKKHRLSRLTSGETADAPASGHSKNNRLSRMFTNKRASDPSIKHNQLAPGASLSPGGVNATPGLAGRESNSSSSGMSANQSYLDKMSSSQKSTTMIIEEFEPDVFRQLIEYIHTGCVLLQARTLLGLLNAADYYGLDQLRKACLRFVSCCITVDTVCSLLSTAERYIQYKCTKSIVQKVLEFVDTHANEIFKLNAFGLLPEHVVRLILARDGLQADEHHKYTGVYTWCEHYCRSYELTNIADIMHNFLDLIQFHKIPTNVLLTEIYPTHVVPDEIFLSALAYQADAHAFEEQSARPRRMTLPNTIMFKDYDDDEDEHHDDSIENRPPDERKSVTDEKRAGHLRRQSNSATGRRESTATTSSQQRLLVGARKSTGGSSTMATSPVKSVSPVEQESPARKAHRKGSLAQVSINSVKRLSHKLSIRKRHSNMPAASTNAPSASGAGENRRRGSSGASSAGGGRHQHASKSIISKQSSLAYSVASGSIMSGTGTDADHNHRDPIQVGRHILEAYLMAQRQRELEEEEQRRREEAENRTIEEAKRRAAGLDPTSADGQQLKLSPGQQQRALAKRPLVKTPSSTRKSFRDFKHISRRLFMRHSSSKSMLQSQQSSTSMSSGSISLDKSGGGGEQSSAGRALSQLEKASSAGVPQQQLQQSDKSRRLLKIKRSETVFEATPSSGASSRKH